MSDGDGVMKAATVDGILEQARQHVVSFEAIGGTVAYPFSVMLGKRVISQAAEIERLRAALSKQEGASEADPAIPSEEEITEPTYDPTTQPYDEPLRHTPADPAIPPAGGEVEKMRDTLELAAMQFDFYEQQHLAKNPPDTAKARTNKRYAELCRAALPVSAVEPAIPDEAREAAQRITENCDKNGHVYGSVADEIEDGVTVARVLLALGVTK